MSKEMSVKNTKKTGLTYKSEPCLGFWEGEIKMSNAIHQTFLSIKRLIIRDGSNRSYKFK